VACSRVDFTFTFTLPLQGEINQAIAMIVMCIGS